MDGWNDGRYTVITQNNIMYDRMGWSTRVNLYKRGNRLIDITSGGTSRTQDTSQSAEFVNSTIAPEVIIHDGNTDAYNNSTHVFDGGYFDV